MFNKQLVPRSLVMGLKNDLEACAGKLTHQLTVIAHQKWMLAQADGLLRESWQLIARQAHLISAQEKELFYQRHIQEHQDDADKFKLN